MYMYVYIHMYMYMYVQGVSHINAYHTYACVPIYNTYYIYTCIRGWLIPNIHIYIYIYIYISYTHTWNMFKVSSCLKKMPRHPRAAISRGEREALVWPVSSRLWTRGDVALRGITVAVVWPVSSLFWLGFKMCPYICSFLFDLWIGFACICMCMCMCIRICTHFAMCICVFIDNGVCPCMYLCICIHCARA
jgi:hypothetical protein